MTVKKTAVLLDYCSFYITGVDQVGVPLDHDLRGVVASDDCINVSALPWNEGETSITLGRFEELTPQPAPPDSMAYSIPLNIEWNSSTRTCRRSSSWRFRTRVRGCESG